MADFDRSIRVAVLAHSLYLANLLFTGLALIVLYILYRANHTKLAARMQSHLRQALVAAVITTLVFIVLNGAIYFAVGYFTVTGLVVLEVYYMFIVPLCVIPGIIGLTRALKGRDYQYPLLGRFLS